LQTILPPHIPAIRRVRHIQVVVDDAGVEERGDVGLQCREIDKLRDVGL